MAFYTLTRPRSVNKLISIFKQELSSDFSLSCINNKIGTNLKKKQFQVSRVKLCCLLDQLVLKFLNSSTTNTLKMRCLNPAWIISYRVLVAFLSVIIQ